MHNAGAVWLAYFGDFGEPSQQPGYKSASGIAGTGVDYHIRGFFQNQQIGVFVDNFNRDIWIGCQFGL